jgi:hypothetical protein
MVQKISSKTLGTIIGVSLTVILFSVYLARQKAADNARHVAQEDDIREAIFRYEMKDHRFPDAVFLSINNQEPSDAFMQRFSDVKIAVRKWVAIAPSEDRSRDGIYDRDTGKPGVALSVGKITWTSDHGVIVAGGYYCGSLCAGGGDFYVVLHNGRWVVEKFDLKIVS